MIVERINPRNVGREITLAACAATLVLAMMPTVGRAEYEFAFKDINYLETYAVLRVSTLPVTELDQFTSLTFTPLGTSLFGYVGKYPGTFDQFDDFVINDDDEALELVGGRLLRSFRQTTPYLDDFDPPPTPINPNPTDPNLHLRFTTHTGNSISDLRYTDPGSGIDVQVRGDFFLVPEPASCGLCLMAVSLGIASRRIRILHV